jgi:predicted ArsR family transcriptional regulator
MTDKQNRNKDLGKQILALLDTGDFTADEMATQLGVDVKLVRPRISEMKKKNIIVPSGEKRKNATGSRKPNVLTKVR